MKRKTINKLIEKISNNIKIACEECCLEGIPSYAVMSGCVNINTACSLLTNSGKVATINIDTKVGDKKWDHEIEVWSHVNGVTNLKKTTLYKLIDTLMVTIHSL